MKWILGLLIGMLIASPAVAQVTRAEVEQIAAASDARILAKLDKINEKLATVETDIAVIKTDIAALKTGLHETKTELKQYVDSRVTASEEKTSAEIRGITRQLSFVQFLLVALVTGLLTMLLALLKQQWDKRKAGDEKLGAQQKELADKQSEIDAQNAEIVRLRAEVERMKNTSGLVSPSGGRLENEGERERA